MEQELIRITEKLQQLVKQQQQLKKENEKLKADQTAFVQKIKDQLEINLSLEQQLEAARISSGIADGASKKELERKLNQYIREIDRCIALLAE